MDVQEAFDTLLTHLCQALKNAQIAGERAFKEGRFEEAQEAAQRGQEIQSRLQKLEALQREWAGLFGGEPVPVPRAIYQIRKQPLHSLKVPQYRLPILAVLEEMGGKGRMQEVLRRLEDLLKNRLRDLDWELLSDGRTIRWQKAAQWARHIMVREGLLASDSPWGVWEITDAGRAYLQEHRAELPSLLGG